MTSSCRDCGIADWQPCVCTDEHTTRERAAEREHARRATITHAITADADWLLHSDDMRAHLDDHERLSRLTAATGDVAGDLVRNSGLELEAALVRVGAEVQCWLEALARETAAR